MRARFHSLIFEERKRIGKIIQQYRIQKGLSLRQCAEKLKFSHEAIYLIEKGKMRISLKIAKRLSSFFKLSFGKLYWAEGKNNFSYRQTLGAKLREKREIKGLSVKETAALLAEPIYKIYHVEEGYALVPLDNIEKWGDFYELPLHVLRGDYFKEGMKSE